MKISVLLIVLSSFLLGACSSLSTTNSDLEDCDKPFPWFCRGEPGAPTVKVKIKDGKLSASPYCTRALNESLLVFRFFPPGQLEFNDVEIVPKNQESKWLEATNDTFKDLIMIQVPMELPDGDYGYGIKVGDACLDPRVHVE